MGVPLGELPRGAEFELPWGTKGTFFGITAEGDGDVVLESKRGPGRAALMSRHRLVYFEGSRSPHVEAVA